ncbi:MAG: proline--tRNA ligase [Chloroflexi bacterium]|nr:proline--tRNA ligase [Chloroflexota bacterium]
MLTEVIVRRSEFFCSTLREAPAEAESPGHSLLLRGGYIQSLGAGLFAYLPLGQRTKARIEQALREELSTLGAQEVELPLVQPAELWARSGRLQDIGPELLRVEDRAGRRLVLAMTHEEAIAEMLRRTVRSYRHLPVLLSVVGPKFRDEPRPRAGLIRAREFTMADSYSCHATEEDLDGFYSRVLVAYGSFFRRIGLSVHTVEGDSGVMGGTQSHECMLVSDLGEDSLLLCPACDFAANRAVASFRPAPPTPEEPQPLEVCATPGAKTIASLAGFLGISPARTVKAALFATPQGRVIFAAVRGDTDVNERKLARAAGVAALHLATAEELDGTGIVPGYASPIGVRGVTVIVDELVAQSPNLVAGANREGYHYRNTNAGRDYVSDRVADIVLAPAGSPCPQCGAALEIRRAIEVGHLFKLGTRYSEAMGATFLDARGHSQPVAMASYGIGIGRTLACLAEQHRDERGLRWPASVAPFRVYLVGLDLSDGAVHAAAASVYERLTAAGVDTLFDDREESAGVKFADADLLGLPLRVTAGKRSLAQEGVELKERGERASVLIPLTDVLAAVQQCLALA